MKKTFLKLLTFIQAAAISVPLCCMSANASEISYTEKVGTINNVGAGYTSTVWAVCKPDNTPVYSPNSNLVLFFIDIGAFSSGANESGVDYDLDENFFSSWDKTLENCRNNGCMVALRFRYDANGKGDPEPATFEKLLSHIEQIKNSGLLEKYSDIIAYVESGFVGKWGEQHGGKYVSVQYKAQLLEALLQAVPDSIPVTVRTPDIFAEWAGIKRSELDNAELLDSITESPYSSDIQANRHRVGLYNDGYMGSNSDLGTYADREKETTWLGNQTFTSYFGGEFSGDLNFAQQYETYLPQNAIPEMYKTHLSYINCNIFQLYKDYTFSADYDVEGVDNSAYYGETVYQFIRDHIGYRFVLRNSEITSENGTVTVNFDVENTGFANAVPQVYGYVILENNGSYVICDAETINCNGWLSCTKTTENFSFELPDNLPEGDWNVYLKLNMGMKPTFNNMDKWSIQFANENVWNGAIGANYLGSVSVSESGKSGKNAPLLSVGNSITVDGFISSPYEWQNATVALENEDGLKLCTYADEEYLYVMSNIPKNDAVAPVYNLQLNNGDERFWIYYQSNGFVYFNHDDRSGCLCKWSDDMVEFRLPLATLGFEPDKIDIKNLRIFLQDSGNDWKLLGDISAPSCNISADFNVYNSFSEITLNEGENYTYSLMTDNAETKKISWLKDGKPMEKSGAELVFSDIKPSDMGVYSAKITSDSGIEKTFEAFRLSVGEKKSVQGDVNADGHFNIADLVMMQDFLLGNGKLTDWQAGDVCKDNKIDVFDYCTLRNMLTSQPENQIVGMEYKEAVRKGYISKSEYNRQITGTLKSSIEEKTGRPIDYSIDRFYPLKSGNYLYNSATMDIYPITSETPMNCATWYWKGSKASLYELDDNMEKQNEFLDALEFYGITEIYYSMSPNNLVKKKILLRRL